jgi:leucyl/phenylalanyl-tRNA--protein transferase
MRLPWLAHAAPFPAPSSALRSPNGLLCAGGDLSVPRLKLAYAQGIFPWFNEGEPILWWSPDPRFVLNPAELILSKRDWRTLRLSNWEVRSDTQFAQVLGQCAAPRANYFGLGTWLSHEMQEAYCALHAAGAAHSVEVFDGQALIGGIYGVAVGGVFCGESMFGARSNASKAALVALVLGLERMGFGVLDCQVRSQHLVDRGAKEIPRARFQTMLAESKFEKSWQSGVWAEPWRLR